MSSFAIACGHVLTADAAEEALRSGGTAVDAAISGALTALVAEPVLAGLLGGGFLTVREPGGVVRVLDFFVQTPGRKRPGSELDFREIAVDFGSTTQEFQVGAGAIAVPGVPTGLFEAHSRYGRIPMSALAEPALVAAREGVRVSAYQAMLKQIVGPILTDTAGSRALFCGPDDHTLKESAVYRNPDLADVLDVYVREGARFVTEGEVAQALIGITSNGGHVTADDLRRYRPEWRRPLVISRGGARISLNPPPALGGILIAFALDLLKHKADPVAVAHTLEATARARIEAGTDCDGLLSADLLDRYRTDVARALSTRGTTQISVVDSQGMGAALTLSNGEGCGLVIPGTGIMPNNMLGEADLMPDGFEAWVPDRRLASMMAPMAVDWPDGRTAMLGSGGSNRIRTALVQVLAHLLDRNQSLSDAIEAPRLHVEVGDTVAVDFEDVAGDEVRESLLATWPDARPWAERSMFYGGVHAVRRSASGAVDAAGDPRRAGVSRVG